MNLADKDQVNDMIINKMLVALGKLDFIGYLQEMIQEEGGNIAFVYDSITDGYALEEFLAEADLTAILCAEYTKILDNAEVTVTLKVR